jgi:hypothetical protein
VQVGVDTDTELANHARWLFDQPLSEFASVTEYSDSEELLRALQSYRTAGSRWIFRGQPDADYGLAPSLERLVFDDRSALGAFLTLEAEEYALTAFKRSALQLVHSPPAANDELEWLSLMRHHGAPTRLLDWTKSPYVGAFFAVADASSTKPSAVWVIDGASIKEEAVLLLHRDFPELQQLPLYTQIGSAEVFPLILRKMANYFLGPVVPVEPLIRNERLTLQQGLFLCSVSLVCSLELNLKHMLFRAQESAGSRSHWLHKLVIDPQVRVPLLRHLHTMNISYATLFPGIDGFARSISTNVVIRSAQTSAAQGHRFDEVF